MTGGLDNTDAAAATGVRERPTTRRGAGAPARPPAATAATTAVLLATAASREGGPAAALRWQGEQTLLGLLIEHLAGLGIRRVRVVTRPEFEDAIRASLAAPGASAEVVASATVADDLRAVAEAARGTTGGMVVALADIVTQFQVLAGLIADPRHPTAILGTAAGQGRPYTPRARSRRGRLISAGSPYHVVELAGHRFLGVIKLAPAAREQLVEVAERLAEMVTPPLPAGWEEELALTEERWRTDAATPKGRDAGTVEIDEDELRHRLAVQPDDATALLLVGLVRSGMPLGSSYVRSLYWSRPLSRPEVERARVEIQDHDEDRALLESAVKAEDGFFTTFFVSPYSKYIARWAARVGLTPNQVTSISLLIGFLSAAAFATGERWGLIAGAVLLQMAFTTDCVDGQLARYTRTFSKLGAWLDSVFDRTKEYLVFAGLAIGASRQGDPVWLLAGAALTLQTVRHTMEFAWGATQQQQLGAIHHPPLEEPRGAAALEEARAEAKRVAKAARADAGGAARASVPAEEAAPAGEAVPAGEALGTAGSAAESAGAPEPAAKPPASPQPASRRLVRRVVAAWTALDRHPRALWVKRIVAFPIGERFAVISVMAALTDARATFVVVLAYGGFAGLYAVTGRLLRSLAA